MQTALILLLALAFAGLGAWIVRAPQALRGAYQDGLGMTEAQALRLCRSTGLLAIAIGLAIAVAAFAGWIVPAT